MITGKLKEKVTIDGIDYPAGSEITIPKQLGLESYFEDFKKDEKIKTREDYKNGYK